MKEKEADAGPFIRRRPHHQRHGGKQQLVECYADAAAVDAGGSMTADMKIVLGLAGLAVLALIGWSNSRRDKGEARKPAEPKPPDEEAMSDLRTNAHYLVWAGFHDRAEIVAMLPEVAVVDVDESVVAPLVDAEISLKRKAQESWPKRTECERLDEAFVALNQRGIFARQYQGYTQEAGAADMSEALAEAEAQGGEFTGYCFYDAQDVESVIDGGRSLWLTFGTNLEQASEVQQALGAPNNVGAVEAGEIIVMTLRESGFEVAWDGVPGMRIEIPHFDWKRRQSAAA